MQFGGRRADAMFEVHDVRQAFGTTLDEALAAVVAAVRDTMRKAHLDGYAEIALSAVDPGPGDELFLVESGANGPGMFEQHGYDFVWARSALAAHGAVRRDRGKCHIDTVVNISRAARRDGWSVRRQTDDGAPCLPLQKACYRRI